MTTYSPAPKPAPSAKLLASVRRLSLPEPNTGCWLWIGDVSDDGYPRWRSGRRGKRVTVTRALLGLPPYTPLGLMALHRCDTPACVNPDHLFVGTQQDNANDKLKKYRSRAARRQFTDDQVADIRRAYDEGESTRSIAARYGMNRSSAWAIATGRYYATPDRPFSAGSR